MATTKQKGRGADTHTTPTTKPNDTALVLCTVKSEPRIDSRLMAQHLGNQHQHVRELLTDYADDFRELGILRFQTGEIRGRGQPERYALLNEDQAYLLLTYSRNTKRVRELKVRLVRAFREARQAADLSTAEYLPTYHALHDEIQALAEHSANARFVHMNLNKLVNRAVGIGSGERQRLPVPHKSLVVVAQSVAASALRGAHDHHQGYEQAKVALQRLGAVLIGGA